MPRVRFESWYGRHNNTVACWTGLIGGTALIGSFIVNRGKAAYPPYASGTKFSVVTSGAATIYHGTNQEEARTKFDQAVKEHGENENVILLVQPPDAEHSQVLKTYWKGSEWYGYDEWDEIGWNPYIDEDEDFPPEFLSQHETLIKPAVPPIQRWHTRQKTLGGQTFTIWMVNVNPNLIAIISQPHDVMEFHTTLYEIAPEEGIWQPLGRITTHDLNDAVDFINTRLSRLHTGEPDLTELPPGFREEHAATAKPYQKFQQPPRPRPRGGGIISAIGDVFSNLWMMFL